MNDPRLQQAREAHRESKKAEQSAARYRDRRDQLVRTLRKSDPAYFTHVRLAKSIGCSPELIAHILRQSNR